ncbi:MAG TPA: OstA-like protein [Phnomibacter sp.]|nr:OstA-like protein [Phnomibacter sp.]
MSTVAYAQGDTARPATAPPVDPARFLHIIRSARLNIEKIDSVTTLQSLAGDVLVRQDKTLFYADSAVINQFTSVMQAFGNIHINDNDSLHTYSKYLRYIGQQRLAYLRDNVRLVDSKGSVLTTSELEYDLNTSVAVYTKGGRVVNKKTVLTSRKGEYNGMTKDVTFVKDVVLIDPGYKIYTDSLVYNVENEIATFVAPTTIVNEGRTIYTRSGYYDLKQAKAFFDKRPRIIDSTTSTIADEMAFDDNAGLGQARGNVVYVDTANNVSILSNQLFVNKKASSFLATEKPLMILVQDGDSTFITADTLYSGKLSALLQTREVPIIRDTADGYEPPDLEGKDSSMDRFFEAWYNVRIFADSAQSVCDSMFYAGTDSAFRLFRDPILWSSDSQITADTIYLFTKNKKSERLQAYFNGFIINKVGSNQYNQVRGNTVNAWFEDGSIHYVRAKGRAETIYYATDEEDAYIGMNRATSDAVDMYFKDRKAKRVIFINDLKGVTYPMRQIPADEDKLRGFEWHEDRRPKSKFEMFGR